MDTKVFEWEWEVVNDNGFVYKRRKRQQLPDSSSTTSRSAAPTPLPNPAVAALKRKKQVLLTIDDKFKKEIEEWEVWEKAVNDMKVKSGIQQQQSSDPQLQLQPHPQLQLSSDFSLVDEYLSQAEALEDVIHNISNGCDVADALCTAAEEILKQSFFDLPVWAHLPRDLIKTLGEG